MEVERKREDESRNQSQEALEYAKKITVELGAVKKQPLQVTNHIRGKNRAGISQSVRWLGYTLYDLCSIPGGGKRPSFSLKLPHRF